LKTLAAIPEVIEAWLVSGEYDYLPRIAAKDTKDYELLRERLIQNQGHTPQQSSFGAAHAEKADLPLRARFLGLECCVEQALGIMGIAGIEDRSRTAAAF
jgi:DNA-binding Lrp family transcriptional regulator